MSGSFPQVFHAYTRPLFPFHLVVLSLAWQFFLVVSVFLRSKLLAVAGSQEHTHQQEQWYQLPEPCNNYRKIHRPNSRIAPWRAPISAPAFVPRGDAGAAPF